MTPYTDLLRQVHPSWIQQGRVTSQVFRPTPKDEKRLSVYDGDRITPENAWMHYTSGLGFLSAGVMAVTVGDCAKLSLPATPDPQPSFPEHAVIDFTGLSSNQIETAAKRLKRTAESRGWLYRDETN
jgi:hypothetical protein